MTRMQVRRRARPLVPTTQDRRTPSGRLLPSPTSTLRGGPGGQPRQAAVRRRRWPAVAAS